MPKEEKQPDLFPSSLSAVNKAMACPDKLVTDDGRELKIMEWQPHVTRGQNMIKVLLEAAIIVTDE